MKRSLVTGGLLALALVGCSKLATVPVNNPLGLNGQTVTIHAPSTSAASVRSQATQSGTVSASFKDFTIPNLPLNPTAFSACYDFNATLSGLSTPLAGTLTLKNIKLNVAVNDGTNGPANLAATTTDLTLKGSGNTASADGKGLCGNIDDVKKMIAVISNAPVDNTVTGTFSFDTDTPLPPGSTLTITFSNGSGTVNVGL